MSTKVNKYINRNHVFYLWPICLINGSKGFFPCTKPEHLPFLPQVKNNPTWYQKMYFLMSHEHYTRTRIMPWHESVINEKERTTVVIVSTPLNITRNWFQMHTNFHTEMDSSSCTVVLNRITRSVQTNKPKLLFLWLKLAWHSLTKHFA